MPNALSDKIKEKITYEVDSENEIKYNQLYAVYSYPNMILPLVGGFLVDRVGLYFSMILFSSLNIIGQGVFTIAGYMADHSDSGDWPFIISLVGRFIYGLGGESLLVCQSVFVSKWFMNKELSLALGFVLSICWLGSTVSGYTIPPLAEATSLGFTLNVGVFTCTLSLLLAIVLISMDKYADRRDKRRSNIETPQNERFHCKDVKELGIIYWIIIINWFFSYTGMMFYNISNDFFTSRYGFDQVEAARIGSNASLVSIIFAPIFGFIWDRFGHRISFWLLSTSALTLSNILLVVIPSSTADHKSYLGIIPIGLMGLASSIYAAVLFPMIPIVVKPQIIGSAYGLCSSLMNVGLSIGPIIVGVLTHPDEKENAYHNVNIVMAWLCGIGVLCSIGLLILNKIWLGGLLQKPAAQLKEEIHSPKFEKSKQVSN